MFMFIFKSPTVLYLKTILTQRIRKEMKRSIIDARNMK